MGEDTEPTAVKVEVAEGRLTKTVDGIVTAYALCAVFERYERGYPTLSAYCYQRIVSRITARIKQFMLSRDSTQGASPVCTSVGDPDGLCDRLP